MCSMCDGDTLDEFLEGLDENIQRYGFTMSGIEPNPDQPPWAYTIGLVEECDHPELSVLGVPLDYAFVIVDRVSQQVLRGERFAVGDEVVVNGVYFHVGQIDSNLWDGEMFNQWWNYYNWRRTEMPEPAAVELIPCGSQPLPWGVAATALPRPLGPIST